jgi:hypothetical protein
VQALSGFCTCGFPAVEKSQHQKAKLGHGTIRREPISGSHLDGLVGQFRTADGLVLLSGGDAGASDVPAAHRFASSVLPPSTSQ